MVPDETAIESSTRTAGWKSLSFSASVALLAHAGLAWTLAEWQLTETLKAPPRVVQVAMVSAPAALPVIEPPANDPPVTRLPEPRPQQAEPDPAPPPPVPEPKRLQPDPLAEPVKATKRSATPEPKPAPVERPLPQPVVAKAATQAVTALQRPVFAAPSVVGIANPRPGYPLMARRLGQEGLVVLAVSVQADGRVMQATIKQSSGFPLLDDAARKTILKWRFQPAKQGDLPVQADLDVPVRFQLRDPS